MPNYIATDARASSITVRHVLSHSSGLPNWRNSDYPLRTYFEPGERFSYSGEGFLYLQRAVEAITGEELDVLARRLVFEPLAMSRSSFVWRPDFLENCAYPHDAFGTPALMYKPGVPNVAWSLQTCAPDYAKFLLAVMEGARLSSATARLWLEPAIEVRHKGAQSLEPSTDDVTTGVAWGLGWGLEPDAGTFFHWGDNGPFTAFTIGSHAHQAAFVLFANGASGLSVLPDIVAQLAPGEHPSLKWLDRWWHDAPVRRLLRAVLACGVEAAWPEIEKAALPADQVLWIAQGLNAKGRAEESAWLRTRADPKE
jgi:CubicO group peptidase (beta-lactamase class C family)